MPSELALLHKVFLTGDIFADLRRIKLLWAESGIVLCPRSNRSTGHQLKRQRCVRPAESMSWRCRPIDLPAVRVATDLLLIRRDEDTSKATTYQQSQDGLYPLMSGSFVILGPLRAGWCRQPLNRHFTAKAHVFALMPAATPP